MIFTARASSRLLENGFCSDSLSVRVRVCTNASRIAYNTFQRQRLSNPGSPMVLNNPALDNDANLLVQVSLSRSLSGFYIRPIGRIRIATISLMSTLVSPRSLPLLSKCTTGHARSLLCFASCKFLPQPRLYSPSTSATRSPAVSPSN